MIYIKSNLDNNTNIINDDILQYALSNGIINIEDIQEKIEMRERQRLLEKHPYSIWHGNDGKWHTYLPDEQRGRIPKRRNSINEIENIIIEYWKDKEENPTISEVFKEWSLKKLNRKDISNATYDRYQRQFDECFELIKDTKIKNITEEDIEDFMINSIREKELTQKGFSNFRTLVFGVFKYAKKKKYISFNIKQVIDDIDFPRNIFRKEVKSDDELVFMENELPLIMRYITDNLDIINIGLLIMFKSGLRVGELSALKYEDVSNDNKTIHVSRTEICYEENGKNIYTVRDFPKTQAGIRDVSFPQKYSSYLQKAKNTSSGKFLFEINGERVKTYQFRNRLKTICKRLKIKNKSPHKVRKTYATILIDNGVGESTIISQMGHTDINTTKTFYYKNRKDNSQKQNIIDSVIGL